VAHFNLGLLWVERGQLERAERAFAAALAGRPPHPRARRELALTLAQRGEYRRAITLFEEELRAERRADPALFANLGLAYARAGEPERAEAALRQALHLEPEQPDALGNLAALYAQRGRWVEAAALYARARARGNFSAPPASK
jgi:Flp pilus assembly protein TadD